MPADYFVHLVSLADCHALRKHRGKGFDLKAASPLHDDVGVLSPAQYQNLMEVYKALGATLDYKRRLRDTPEDESSDVPPPNEEWDENIYGSRDPLSI